MEDEHRIVPGRTHTDRMRHKWPLWKHHKRYYAGGNSPVGQTCQKQLRSFFHYEEPERGNDLRQMENHFYAFVYDMRSSTPQEDSWPAHKRYKAKIVKLHTYRLNTVLLDNEEDDRINGEEPTRFHALKMQKPRSKNTPKGVGFPRQHTRVAQRNHTNLCSIL
jgi:hypothetical protein